ncbi:MAG: hypothetical protein ACLQHF_06175 [Terracidiphilus sp.]
MKKQKAFVSIATFLTLGLGIYGAQARAVTPSFTVSATNVTMSSSGSNGTGLSIFTLTSVNGYTGTVGVTCYPANEPAGAKLPYCGGSLPPVGYTLNANAVVTGSLPFFNVPVPEPVSMPVRRSQAVTAGLALAGALLVGIGFRRKVSRCLFLVLLGAVTFAGLGAMSGCGGSNSVVTPGTYSYTVKALDTNSVTVSATFEVTVP